MTVIGHRIVYEGIRPGRRPFRLISLAMPAWAMLTIVLTTAAANRSMAADWADIRVVGPIICRADFSLAGMDGVLTDLSRLQSDLVRLLGVSAAKEPIELYLFHDKATYSRYLNRYLPNVPYRRALYIKSHGPGRVFAYWSREFEVDLRHECTHAMLHASLPYVPLWLDEGLAQYFEVPASQRAVGHPQMSSIRSSLRWGAFSNIESLEKKADLAEMGRTEYRDSWAWVHFMIQGPDTARDELRAFLGDIQRGDPPGLLSLRIQRKLPGASQLFAEHFRSVNR